MLPQAMSPSQLHYFVTLAWPPLTWTKHSLILNYGEDPTVPQGHMHVRKTEAVHWGSSNTYLLGVLDSSPHKAIPESELNRAGEAGEPLQFSNPNPTQVNKILSFI